LENDLDNENRDVDRDEDRDDPGLSGEGAVCTQWDEHRGWYPSILVALVDGVDRRWSGVWPIVGFSLDVGRSLTDDRRECEDS